MPLYTYIATYCGGMYVEQVRRSNFKGFASGVVGDFPDGALPGLDKMMRNDIAQTMWCGRWQPIVNRKNVWRTSFRGTRQHVRSLRRADGGLMLRYWQESAGAEIENVIRR